MDRLYAGFSRMNVTPMLGIGIAGYFKPRYAEDILDELEINALALSCGETQVLLLSMDLCEFPNETASALRCHVAEVTGVPMAAVYLHATHTHTAPFLVKDSEDELEREYYCMVYRKMADAARLALEDLKPARFGWGTGSAPQISFVRRYRMKDGSVKTNPGVGNPDIVEPIGVVDETVNVLRFDREPFESLALVNFACHPDVVGGSKLSADWPAFARKTVETALQGTKCIFFNGAQGDVNHVNVQPKGGDLNDMFMDFDDVSRGYGHARYMGRAVAGGVLQVWDKVAYVEVEKLKYLQRTVKIPANVPRPHELAEARRIEELHQAGRDEELPYTGMLLTTVVAEAERMLRLEHGPETFDMELTGIAIGNMALLGIPGEPFTGIGLGLKAAPEWDMVLPTCLTNGSQGYFPMRDSYEEGGYEARSSNFKAGAAELIVEEGLKLLYELREKRQGESL